MWMVSSSHEDFHGNMCGPLQLEYKKMIINCAWTPGIAECLCIKEIPSFVGDDYYCKSGCPGNVDLTTFYSKDIVWYGRQSRDFVPNCCTISNQPWFHKVLDTAWEYRVSINQSTSVENILTSLYDIYMSDRCSKSRKCMSPSHYVYFTFPLIHVHAMQT